jgi:Reverse transcriptase (RNA-dependent DNA polymerase)
VFLNNRLPSKDLIPYKALFNKDVDYHFLRVLGCLCYPLTQPYNKHKLELRSKPCVFIGYGINQKGYKCLHVPTGRIYMSRNVQFIEDEFPFVKSSRETQKIDSTPPTSHPLFLLQKSSPALNSTVTFPIHNPDDSHQGPTSFTPTTQAATQANIQPTMDPAHNSNPYSAPPIVYKRRNQKSTPVIHADPNPLANGNQVSIPSFDPHFHNLSQNQVQTSSAPQSSQLIVDHSVNPTHTMITRTKDKTYKKKEYSGFVSYHVLSDSDPTTFLQANKSPQWRSAMADEITALARNQTWTLVPPPFNQKVIGCKWVFKTKRNSDGSIERHKTRLVAKGFNQVCGIDFEETYSPIVRPTTIRVTLSLALNLNWTLRQLDVSNAFLNGDLNEQVFMQQPQGFTDPTNPDFVCLLHKSLYGLRQAPRVWFEKLSSTLLSFGFSASIYDPSMFLAHHQGHILILLVYVDDIIVTGSDPVQVDQCIQHLNSRFVIRDLGQLHFFLGIEATHNKEGICLTQTKYLTDLLKRVNMMNCKSVLSPMASGTILSTTGVDPCKDPSLYRSVIGALQYATLTRPDISYSVNKLSQYMHSPNDDHWTAAKRVLRYIAGTLDFGLQFYKQSLLRIQAFSDSDWAGNLDDRRSTSGYYIYLGRNLVSWSSKKQPTVSKSSTEAEYRSLALCC